MSHYTYLDWFSFPRQNRKLTTALAIYMDNQRVDVSAEDNAFAAVHQVASQESNVEIQDTARIRRAPSQHASAWASSIIRTNNIGVGLLVSDNSWVKEKIIIKKLVECIAVLKLPLLDTKQLLSNRGFLVYVARTYDTLTPHLKGINLTLDLWQSNQDNY